MQCKRCNGRGTIWYDDETYGKCPECIGGVASCCDVGFELDPLSEPLLKRAKVHTERVIIEKKDPIKL